MPDSAYLDLARNVGPFRSWGNYIRSMDEHGLGGTDHSPENIGILRRTLDVLLINVDRAGNCLNLVTDTDSNLASRASRTRQLSYQLLNICLSPVNGCRHSSTHSHRPIAQQT